MSSGGEGNDTIFSDSENSTLLGGDGNDMIGSWIGYELSQFCNPSIDGGAGDDYVDLSYNGSATVIGGSGTDTLSFGFGEIYGSNFGSVGISDSPQYGYFSGTMWLFHTDIEQLIAGGLPEGSISAGGGPNTTLVALSADAGSVNGVGLVEWGYGSYVEASITNGGSIDVDSQTRGFTISGTDKPNVITSTVGCTIDAGGGDDLITANARGLILDGGTGNDTLKNVDGSDAVFTIGQAVYDSSGNLTQQISHIEEFIGGSGNERVTADPKSSTSITLIGGNGNDTLIGGAGNDFLYGGNGNDSLVGGGGNNQLRGEAGNDSLTAGHGSDFFSGGTGFDQVSYSDRVNGVKVGIGKYADDGETNELDNVYYDVECVVGGKGSDAISATSYLTTGVLLVGAGGNDTLIGGPGNDSVYGGTGNDQITGNGGADQLFGEAGNDSIFAQDKIKDTVDGGIDDDTALVDVIDSIVNVEHVTKS